MVKVGRIRSDKWIGLGIVLATLACSSGDRSAAPVTAPAEARVASTSERAPGLLTEVRAESSPEPRLVLRTSGSPAYTSYSPQPDVYVVDLPRVAKGNGVTVPTNLPSWVASVSVDEAIELGRPLTRVTLRFSEPVTPDATSDGDAVMIALGRGREAATPARLAAIPETDADDAPEIVAVENLEVDAPAPRLDPVAPVAVAASQAAPVIDTPAPIVTTPRKVGHPAKNLQRVETIGSGIDLRVVLHADGDLTWKTFTLKSPERLVIDLPGVTNRVRTTRVDVSDSIVRTVRIAQFATSPQPVTRVVIDMDEIIGHGAQADGETLAIAFGNDLSTTPIVPARVAEPVRVAAATPQPREEVFAPAPERREWTQTERVFSAQETAPPPRTDVGSERLTQTDAPVTSSVRATVPQSTAVAPGSENVFLDGQPTTRRPVTIETGVTSTPGQVMTAGERVYTGEPIDLTLNNADIKDVLRTFAQLTGLNIAIDPQVSGTVTVEFEDVPWDQALELILRQNGLGFDIQGNVMRVGTIERLAAEQAQLRRLEEDAQLNVPLQTVVKDLSYAEAGDIVPLLEAMASRRGQLQFDPRTNQVIITEIPQYLTTMLNLIETLDIATPQVVIEARVVETTKTFARRLGINWGFDGIIDPALGTGTGLVFPNRGTIGVGPFDLGVAGSEVLSLTLSNVLGTFDLDLTLTAAENDGLVRIVSAPKILAQDNTAAEIQSGVQIPIQTRVNQTTTVTYVDATLRLSVTPRITAEDTVIMEVTVQKSEPLEGINVAGGANAPLSTRRATTTLMVRDGGTAVIGGIYQATDNDQRNKIPFLGDLPVVGNLFRNSAISERHDELLIFITPRIVRMR